MEKILIIYAHPKTKGHCSSILEEVEGVLKEKKAGYELIDLYGINYDPILKEDEHYTSGGRAISPQNKEFQEKISFSEKIILIYPIWWNSPPAILKGFLDRVFTSHFAFKFSPMGIPIKLLKGRKALVFCTGGTQRLLSWIFLRDRGAKIVAKDTLGFCGIKAKVCQFGNCKKVTFERDASIRKITRRKTKKFIG